MSWEVLINPMFSTVMTGMPYLVFPFIASGVITCHLKLTLLLDMLVIRVPADILATTLILQIAISSSATA